MEPSRTLEQVSPRSDHAASGLLFRPIVPYCSTCMSSVTAGSTANDREACFYCSRDAKKKFCCPACKGPGKRLGQEAYLLCESCLATQACRYCHREPQPSDAFTDPDLRSLVQGDHSLDDGSSLPTRGEGRAQTLQPLSPSHARDAGLSDFMEPATKAPHDGHVWLLVEISCVLLHMGVESPSTSDLGLQGSCRLSRGCLRFAWP